ncbi:MAG: hypothetical protein LAO21_12585 [Acidobacteriia bacterium]|nr:hypothetical protein [Terriglobia bacterium]
MSIDPLTEMRKSGDKSGGRTGVKVRLDKVHIIKNILTASGFLITLTLQ